MSKEAYIKSFIKESGHSFVEGFYILIYVLVLVYGKYG